MDPTATRSGEVVGQLVLIEADPIRQRIMHAVAGFLAGYSGTTLEAYRLDLRGWIGWLDNAFLYPFEIERAHIELYARWSEAQGKARSTIGRRLSTICGFYKYCAQERLIERDPSAHVRRPKQDYESSTLGLDRNELGAFLVQAGLCGGRDHALACLLALNGLRISEALGANIDNLDVNRGHRTLFIHRKGNKTAALDAGVPLRDVQEAASHSDPRTTMRYDRGRGSLNRHPTYIVSTFVAGASR